MMEAWESGAAGPHLTPRNAQRQRGRFHERTRVTPEQDIIRKRRGGAVMSCVKFVLVLSLGAVLTGCGYMWRTIPPGYYDTDPRTRGDKVYETDKYGNVIRQKAVIVRDPSSGN